MILEYVQENDIEENDTYYSDSDWKADTTEEEDTFYNSFLETMDYELSKNSKKYNV